ncbi:sulfotransferase 1C2-like [Ixodes scapularis]|uniref:sulfotransferase 1C2-like n=1 Tax=Ixodes scapularis TaxID=6945 RepID=UPI001AA00074|nr:sulfotransferase 1C2-like [Ixodes scapularis]
MHVAPKRTPHLQMIDGVPRSPIVKPEVYREALSFKPAADDVILVTYPKSGTHWVSQIALLILNRGQSPRDLADFVRQAPCLEMNGVSVSYTSPRFLRTHLPFGQIRYSNDSKYIYVARNPLDACVSFYHYIKNLPHYRFEDGKFEDFVEAFIKGRVGQADHLEHVLSGYARRHASNVLFLTYEELKADTAGIIVKLAKFFGETYASMFEKDTGLMNEILSKSGLEYMRNTYEMSIDELCVIYNIRPLPQDIADAPSKIKIEPRKLSAMRKGTTADWREHFTPELLQQMRAWIYDKSQCFDLMSLWRNELAASDLDSSI